MGDLLDNPGRQTPTRTTRLQSTITITPALIVCAFSHVNNFSQLWRSLELAHALTLTE